MRLNTLMLLARSALASFVMGLGALMGYEFILAKYCLIVTFTCLGFAYLVMMLGARQGRYPE